MAENLYLIAVTAQLKGISERNFEEFNVYLTQNKFSQKFSSISPMHHKPYVNDVGLLEKYYKAKAAKDFPLSNAEIKDLRKFANYLYLELRIFNLEDLI